MDFSAIREGLRANLARINGLRASARIPNQIVTPMAYVGPVSLDYLGAYNNGTSEMVFEVVLLLTPDGMNERAQELLDEYIDPSGPRSIVAAIERDKTLGGAADSLAVVRMRDYGEITVKDVDYLGCRFDVEVLR